MPFSAAKSAKLELSVFVGTAFLTMVEYLQILDDGIVIAVDVPAELNSLSIRLVEGQILETIPLGDGQTIYQLIKKHGSQEQIRCLR